jgi:hypothetical protein
MARASSGMDLNGQIAALLRDFGAVQKSKQSVWGYKRAASAILALDQPIASFLKPDGTLRKIAKHRPIIDTRHPRGAADRNVCDGGRGDCRQRTSKRQR